MRYIIALALVLAMTGCTDEEPTEPEFKYRIVIDKVEAGTRERGNPPETVDTWDITFRVLNQSDEISTVGGNQFRCLWSNDIPKDSKWHSPNFHAEYPNAMGGYIIDEKSSAGLYTMQCLRDPVFGELNSIEAGVPNIQSATIPR